MYDPFIAAVSQFFRTEIYDPESDQDWSWGTRLKETSFIPAVEREQLPEGSCRALFELWVDQKSDGNLPARSDFTPFTLRLFLGNIMLVDVLRDEPRGADGRWKFRARLVGTNIANAVNNDITGQNMNEIEGLEAVVGRCQTLADSAEPYYVSGAPLTCLDDKYLGYDALALPLAKNGKDVDMILCLLSFPRR